MEIWKKRLRACWRSSQAKLLDFPNVSRSRLSTTNVLSQRTDILWWVKKQGNNGGYSPLTKQIDIDHCFPSKTCNCLVDIEQLQEKLKSKNYTYWGDLLTVCEECGGVGKVWCTYTDRLGKDYQISGVCPICGGDSLTERTGVVKIADAIVKPKYLLLLCELAKATGGRVLLLNGGTERQHLYFLIGEDIEMVIMQARPSVARREELLFELKIDWRKWNRNKERR